MKSALIALGILLSTVVTSAAAANATQASEVERYSSSWIVTCSYPGGNWDRIVTRYEQISLARQECEGLGGYFDSEPWW